MVETIFTKIINKEIPSNIIYEDDETIAILDIAPFEKGHSLVIPKKTYSRITQMSEEEYLNLQKIVLKIAKNMKKKLDCEIGTLVYGEDVPHVHIHIFPINKNSNLLQNIKIKKYLDNEAKNYAIKLRLN